MRVALVLLLVPQAALGLTARRHLPARGSTKVALPRAAVKLSPLDELHGLVAPQSYLEPIGALVAGNVESDPTRAIGTVLAVFVLLGGGTLFYFMNYVFPERRL